MDFDENTTSLTCPKDKLELVFFSNVCFGTGRQSTEFIIGTVFVIN